MIELCQSATELVGGDDALLSRGGALGRVIQELQRIDAGAANLGAMHEQAIETLRELQHELSNYADRLELDPARLRELDERITLLQSAKRKYGPNLADVIAFGEEAKTKAGGARGSRCRVGAA